MSDDRMVVAGGVRYRPKDAERLGLVAAPAKAETAPERHKAQLEPENTKKSTRRRRGRADDAPASGQS